MNRVHNVQIADGDDNNSVRQRKCWATLLSGRFRATLFSVLVKKGSTLVFKTMFGAERAEKAAADEGNNCGGISVLALVMVMVMVVRSLWFFRAGGWREILISIKVKNQQGNESYKEKGHATNETGGKEMVV